MALLGGLGAGQLLESTFSFKASEGRIGFLLLGAKVTPLLVCGQCP